MMKTTAGAKNAGRGDHPRWGPWLAIGGMSLVLLLSGCGGILDACWDFDGPEFEQDSVPAAAVGQSYDATVSVNIVRNAFDDLYLYEFGLSGQLPPGVEFRQLGSSRRVHLVGLPTTAGSYSFKVSVFVREFGRVGDDSFVLCWNGTEQDFLITVAARPPG